MSCCIIVDGLFFCRSDDSNKAFTCSLHQFSTAASSCTEGCRGLQAPVPADAGQSQGDTDHAGISRERDPTISLPVWGKPSQQKKVPACNEV